MIARDDPAPAGATTIGLALRRAAAALPDSDAPRLDVELLLGHVLDARREDLLARMAQALPRQEAQAFDALVARRAAGEPLAYIVGSRHFCGLELRVTPDVLVPRPETEQLAEWAFERIRRRQGETTLLDVGTGSGALALACVSHSPSVHAHGTDVSAPALRVADTNARAHGLEGQVTWHLADLLPAEPSTFDVVVANLPYVAEREVAEVASDVLDWEPHAALFGGADGLDAIRRLMRVLPARLAPGADVGLEIGWRQGPAATAIVAESLPGAVVTLHHDLAGHPRVVTAEGYSGGAAT